MKRLLSIFLCAVIAVTVLSIQVSAEDNETVYVVSGDSGKGILPDYAAVDEDGSHFVPDEEMIKDINDKNSVSMEAVAEILRPGGASIMVGAPLIPWYASGTLAIVRQFPQEKNYYCGPAAAQTIIAGTNRSVSQSTLAGSAYLRTEEFGNTPWYLTDGSSYSNYPMVNTLRAFTGINYVPAPYGPLGSYVLTENEVQMNIFNSIEGTNGQRHGVALCGISKRNEADASHLNGYPTDRDIGHWLAAVAYKEYANKIRVADPASGGAGLSFSGVEPLPYHSIETITAFVAHRGMIY